MKRLKSRGVYTVLIVSLLVLAFPAASHAQVEQGKDDLFLTWFLDSDLNPEVTVGGKRVTLLEATSTVVVIDRRMIDKYKFMSVAEAVSTIANFNVYRTYLKRNLPTSRGILQDHYATRVLVLINNIPTYHGGTGEGNLDRVDINDVERIEVLKGTGSYLYGNNAFSGAVNIVLKKPGEDVQKGEFHGAVGNDNAFIGGGNYTFVPGAGRSFFVSANFSDEDGIDFEFTDETGESGQVKEYLNTGNVNVFAQYGGHSLLYNGYSNEESYLGVSAKYSSGAGNPHEVQGHLASYTYRRVWGDAGASKLMLFYDWNERDLSRTFDDNTRALIEGYRYGAYFDHKQGLSDVLSVEFGANYDNRNSVQYANYDVQQDRVLSENFMEDREADEYSLYGQVNLQFTPVSFLLGAKYTDSEFGGDNVSSRGTVVWTLNDTNSIKLIAGESFRSPTLFELYFRTDSGTVYGNTELEPETSTSVELQYQIISGNFLLQATAYTSEYNDKIFRDRGPLTLEDGTYLPDANRYVNGDTFEADGAEVEFKYVSELFSSFVNVGYIDGDNGDEVAGNDNYNFKYVPEYTASIGVQGSVGPVNLSLVGSYLDETQGPHAPVDDSWTADLNIAIDQETDTGIVKHAVTVKNLTDEKVSFPEYVRRRGLNEVPLSVGRKVYYTVNIRY
jgi:outer membrane receptor protein involved in Fe transport